MKRRPLLTVILLLLAFLLLLPMLLCISGFCLPAQYDQTFLGELSCKVELLRNAKSPRIILVGGSSVPFSVKSDLIQSAFPEYTVVDFGLYADIGTPVMLDLLEEELHEGDIVIISPEQDTQALSSYFSGESLWQALDGNFDLLGQLSSNRYEVLAATFPSFAGRKLYYAIHGNPEPDGIYRKASFDSHGDIASGLRAANIMAAGYDPNQAISFSFDIISEDFIALMNDFSRLCEEVGASVYYRFPPMNEAAVEGETQIDEFYDYLNTLLNFPILGDPNRSIMESGWFYDTNFHLNDSGAIVFTKYLIEDLKILFLDTSPTEIPLPAMPEFSASVSANGDNSCAEYFIYRWAETGWIITGITDAGRSRGSLTVPVSYEGALVIGVDETVFCGLTDLKELTLQKNIGTLFDGMFRGCSDLQKLHLTGEPSDYTVGDRLMEGANFMICVSADAAARFQRHYSWQKYSAYIQIE